MDPKLPRALSDVIDKALKLDPAERYRSMAEFEAALARVGAQVPDGSADH